jgi:hypothetical protein
MGRKYQNGSSRSGVGVWTGLLWLRIRMGGGYFGKQ